MQLLRVPGDLPGERRPLSRDGAAAGATRARSRAVLAGEAPGRGRRGATTSTVLRALPDGSVDLGYADPPFATGSTRRLVSIRTGTGEQTRRGFRGREYRYEAVSDLACDDDLPLDEHLAALGERVGEIHRVLAPHGSLYLHVRLADRPPRPAAARRGVRGRSGSSTSWSGRTTTAAGRATAGRASTTRSCGTRRATSGGSSATRSTGSRTSRRASSAPRRRPAASCRRTCGG